MSRPLECQQDDPQWNNELRRLIVPFQDWFDQSRIRDKVLVAMINSNLSTIRQYLLGFFTGRHKTFELQHAGTEICGRCLCTNVASIIALVEVYLIAGDNSRIEFVYDCRQKNKEVLKVQLKALLPDRAVINDKIYPISIIPDEDTN